MLDKFQEQDLMASVEILSALSKTLENEDVLYGEETKAARQDMQYDILKNQKFTINWILEQAQGLFQNWDSD